MHILNISRAPWATALPAHRDAVTFLALSGGVTRVSRLTFLLGERRPHGPDVSSPRGKCVIETTPDREQRCDPPLVQADHRAGGARVNRLTSGRIRDRQG